MALDQTPQPSSTRHSQQDSAGLPASDALFAARAPERSPLPVLPWIIAGAVVLVILGVLLLLGHRRSTAHGHSAAPLDTILPLAGYSPSLAIGGLQMSESTSLSGGKSTFIDGHIRNNGSRMLIGATVQVLFANDEALPPQVETLPLALIRTREPYVDTQPVAASPLAPGDEREFRLIFEDIRANWNQQLPQVRVVQVSLR